MRSRRNSAVSMEQLSHPAGLCSRLAPVAVVSVFLTADRCSAFSRPPAATTCLPSGWVTGMALSRRDVPHLGRFAQPGALQQKRTMPAMGPGDLFSDMLPRRRDAIDLRSDTVTQPTPLMRKAMAKAEVGDDVFGEDPTVNQLESEVAALLGKEAAVFVPTGTMANLISELTWCSQRGSEMILGDQSHVYVWEQANAAQFGGIGYRPLPNRPDGTIDLDQMRAAVRANSIHCPVSRLVCLENTHGGCGGKVLPVEYVDDVGTLAGECGLKLHIDGARIWNAAAYLGLPPARLVAGCDSVSVCFSKGLGAPAGSMILGSSDFISRARRTRRALGGSMRQSGVLAAAALEGVRKMLPRIGDDHVNARKLAEGIEGLGYGDLLMVTPGEVQTNMVFAHVGARLKAQGVTAQQLCDQFQSKGLLAVPVGPHSVRFVTHYQISGQDVSRAVGIVKGVLKRQIGPINGEAKAAAPAAVTAPAKPPAPAVNGHAPVVNSAAMQMPEGISIAAPAMEVFEEQAPQPLAEAAGPAPAQGDAAVAQEESSAVVLSQAEEGTWQAVSPLVSPEVPPEVPPVSPLVSPEASPEAPLPVPLGPPTIQVAAPFASICKGQSYEEVAVKGVTVSEEGFIALLVSKSRPRALKVAITPGDPMSSGLDVREAETPEALTVLQLLQGIDVGSCLPKEALNSKVQVSSGLTAKLKAVHIHEVRPSKGGFKATLKAKIEPSTAQSRGGVRTTFVDTPEGDVPGATDQADSLELLSAPPPTPGAAVVAQGEEQAVSEPVEKETTSKSGFEAVALALRYDNTRLFVKPELLEPEASAKGEELSMDAASVESAFPDLLELEATRTRKRNVANDRINAELDRSILEQQLRNAMREGEPISSEFHQDLRRMTSQANTSAEVYA